MAAKLRGAAMVPYGPAEDHWAVIDYPGNYYLAFEILPPVRMPRSMEGSGSHIA